VIKPISQRSENKARTRLVSWLAALAEKAGTRLFADDDLTALAHGWHITRCHGGLGRRYRDPRFGALLPCPRCGGHGDMGGEPCPPCDGTGRVTLAPSRTCGDPS
jgi:hypothetical protein